MRGVQVAQGIAEVFARRGAETKLLTIKYELPMQHDTGRQRLFTRKGVLGGLDTESPKVVSFNDCIEMDSDRGINAVEWAPTFVVPDENNSAR